MTLLPTPKRVTGLLDFVKNLNNKRLNKKFDKAEDEARKQGVDVLGLPINNTATDRALALKKYELDYSQTLKRPLMHGTTSKFETFNKSKPDIFTTYRKSYADWYAHTKFKDNPVPIKVLVAPKEKTKSHLWNVNYPPSEYVPNKGKPRYIYRHMRTFDEPEYLRYTPYVKGGSRKQVSHFNPKMLGITALGAGGTVSGLLSAEEMPSLDQNLSIFSPKKQHEGDLLDENVDIDNLMRENLSRILSERKLKDDIAKYGAIKPMERSGLRGYFFGELADGMKRFTSLDRDPTGASKMFFSGGAKALDDLSYGMTPMQQMPGRIPTIPTNEAMLNFMELIGL